MGRQRYRALFPRSELYNAAQERKENYIGKTLSEIRKQQGLSLAELSALLYRYGIVIGRQGLGKWESGDAVPNGYQLLALCHALHIDNTLDVFTGFPKSSPALNDLGLKKLRDYQEDLIASGRYAPTPPKSMIDMPVSMLPASAGTGAFLEEESFELISFPESSVPPGADFGVHVSGDSMEPIYHDGQIVWIQRCSSLSPGEAGLFLYDGDGYIKLYGQQEDTAYTSDGVLYHQPVLISYNEKYPPKVISPELSFSIVGRVLS